MAAGTFQSVNHDVSQHTALHMKCRPIPHPPGEKSQAQPNTLSISSHSPGSFWLGLPAIEAYSAGAIGASALFKNLTDDLHFTLGHSAL